MAAASPCCEALIQELHEAKAKISRYEAIIQHFEENENDNLPQPEPQIRSVPTTVQEPCLECEQLTETFSAKIASLNLEIDSERKEIKELQINLKDKCAEADSYYSQLTSLQTRLNSTEEKFEQLTSTFNEKNEEIVSLCHALEKSNTDLQNSTERCSALQDKLAEMNEQFQELECEKAALTSELAASKANPEMGERGNSLFSEVEEHRKEAVAKFMVLRGRYNDLKILTDRQKSTIQNLEGQLKNLRSSSSEDPRIAILKERINTSDAIIEELKKTNKQLLKMMDDMSKTFDHSMCSFGTMHNLVNHAEDASRRYLHEKNDLSMERYDLMMKMNDAKGSLHFCKQDYMKIQAENKCLQNSYNNVVEELEMARKKLAQGCPSCQEKRTQNGDGSSEGGKGVKFSSCTKTNDSNGQRPKPKPKEYPIYSMKMDPVTGKCSVFQVNATNDENKPPTPNTNS